MLLNEVKREYFTPMIQQYMDIKYENMDSILFYRVGDFYEMFFDDAYIASKELELQLTGKDAGYTERVPMCGIPHHAYLEYAKRLVDRGYKVSIVEQTEDPQTAKGLVKRDVIKIITPGTIIDAGLNDKENNYLVSLSSCDKSYQLLYADVSTGEMYLTEIPELDILLNEIINLNAHEIVLSKSFNSKLLDTLKNNYQVVISNEEDDHIDDNLKYLTFNIDQKYNHVAGILLNYIKSTQKKDVTHLQPIKYFSNKDYMHIDPYSKRNLELMETIRQNKKTGTLVWLLDKCETAMGSRMLKKWIDRPLTNVDEINSRLNYVEALLNDYVIREDIKDALKYVYDLERIISKVSLGSANAKDLVWLRTTLDRIPRIKNLVKEIKTPTAKALSDSIDTHENLKALLDRALVDNPPLQIKEGGMIKPLFNAELDELKEISQNSKEWILNYEASEKEKTGIKTLHVGYNRVFGYYIEVSKGQIDQIKDEYNYVRKQTLTNGERFITPELKHYEEIIVGASDKIVKLEYDLFIQLREEAKKYTKSLQKLAQIISTIDVLVSFAHVSSINNYVRPTFNDKREVNIIAGRHPVIEQMLDEQFVENDIIVNSYNTILITGPNMSGKSTYMRQFALIVIMAQIGCFVSAKSADLMIFDQIFTRIGASDDLLQGQSTFMVEMVEANYAISSATKNSLILFDELGRGTATYDGMALVQAIIEYVHEKIKCTMLISTHYHELTDLEKTLKHMKNVHVEAKEINHKITFLHKVLDGPTDKSYGINVAELAGLPRSLIERSKMVLESLEGENTKREKTLDLFNFDDFEEDPKEKENEKALNLLNTLRALDLDNMSARDALQFLYEQKKRSEEE